jgi:hypothetical protein
LLLMMYQEMCMCTFFTKKTILWAEASYYLSWQTALSIHCIL